MTSNNTSPGSASMHQSNPLLGGFPSPFPFPLGPGGLNSLGLTAASLAAAAAAAAGNKTLLEDKTVDLGKPSLPPMGGISGLTGLSMQSMMDLTSTHQALLSLARSAAASNLPNPIPSSHTSNLPTLSSGSGTSVLETSLTSSIAEPKKRSSSGTGRTAECPLDLSGPQTMPNKRARLSMETDYALTDMKNHPKGDSDKQDSSWSTSMRLSLSAMPNGSSSSLLPTHQLNTKPSNLVQVDPKILSWSVDEVVDFVSSIDICKEYSEVRT